MVAEEERQREAIIINSLLRQVQGVGRATIERLYRAGLTTIEGLQVARADELAVATGVSLRLAERICAKVQAYRASVENNHRDPADLGQRARLTKMVDELRSYHESVQRASRNGRSNSAFAAEKRDYTQQRESCLLWINVLLAEEGELELVEQLKNLKFDQRIRRLEEYISSPISVL